MNLPQPLLAEETSRPILQDHNNDGLVMLLGFGDSLTYGVGDGIEPGESTDEFPATNGEAGYLLRLRHILGVLTQNGGEPGEKLIPTGLTRFPELVQNSNADLVLIMEGANDAIISLPSQAYRQGLQRLVNVSFALGKQPVVLTLPPPCCDRASLVSSTHNYSSEVRSLATANDIPLVDLERAWNNSCPVASSCEFYNRPEGLHPNTLGYTAMAQTIMATLLEIDIFTEQGQTELETALDLAPGTVLVVPDLEESIE